jgi:cell wall-associated NlpC family hydrolase
MKIFIFLLAFFVIVFFVVLHEKKSRNQQNEINKTEAGNVQTFNNDTVFVASSTDPQKAPEIKVVTKKTKIDSLIEFAKSLIGTPYKYASSDPSKGFDCSGFINYVFNHFHIPVPRSSRDFRDVGKEIALKDAKPGDLILFTGTDSTEREIGHIGLIIANKDGISFIHSSSGKADGVVITELNDYYRGRFVKVERVFFTE